MRKYAIALLIFMVTSVYIYESHPFLGGAKYAHISVDDVTKCYQRLTKDSLKYKSVFDDNFFSYLKKLHEDYGCAVTLYSFKAEGDFDISEMPLKFYREFKDNSSWLKIGFHAVAPSVHHPKNDYEAFSKGFDDFNSAVEKFAGENVKTKILRLDFYYADEMEIDFLKTKGITTLLSADDDRRSYCLPHNKNRILIDNNSIHHNGIKYLRTNIRIENIDIPYLNLIKNRDRDTVVVFTHEWKLSRVNRYKLKRTIEILSDCKYKFISE